MDKELFIKAWDTKELNLKKSEEFWDLRADEFNENDEKEPLVEMFLKKGIINGDSQVLDLGCGPGKYSIEFAAKVKSVTAVDISSNMLKCAEDNAKKIGLNNLEFYKCPWQEVNLEKYSWNKKFDLAFASMTPGIINPEDFFKFMESSKGYCYISGFLEREDKLKNKLGEFLEIKKVDKNDTKIYYMLNVLWNMGIYPEIKYIDRFWIKEMSIEKAHLYFCGQMEQNGKLTDGMSEKVYKFLKGEIKDGIVKEEIKSKIAQMYWKVK